MIKKIIIVCSITLLSLVYGSKQVTAEMSPDGYDQMDSYQNVSAYTLNGEVYIHDINTNINTKISTQHSDHAFAGLTVLADGIYWVPYGLNSSLYKYSFSNKTVQKLIDFSQISDLEKKEGVDIFNMINNHFFVYNLGSRADYNKQYDLNTGTSYGLKSQIPVDGFSGENAVEDLYNFYNPEFALFKTSPSERINDGEDTNPNKVTNFEYYALGDKQLLSKAWEAQGGINQLFGYRITNLDSKTTTIIREHISLSDNYQFWNNKYSNRYTIGDKSTDVLTMEPNYYRFDAQTGQITKTILETTHANNKIVEIRSGNMLLWRDTTQNKYFLYNANTDKTCEINKDGIISNRDTNITRSSISQEDAYWLVNNKIISKKLTCVGEETVDTTPVTNTNDNTTQTETVVLPGNLIKSSTSPAVYYLGNNNKRYVFYSEDIFKTWYSNFSSVKTISPTQMENIMIGGNVTYHPSKLVKITTDPKVYAIDKGGILRHIKNEQVAISLYGSDWAIKIKDIPDFLFINYTIGQDINSASDFDPRTINTQVSNINIDKSL